MIEHLDHGAVVGILLSLQRPTRRIARVIDSQLPAILFEQGLAPGVDGGVHQPSCVIEKERLVFVRLHKIDGIHRRLIHGKSICIKR